MTQILLKSGNFLHELAARSNIFSAITRSCSSLVTSAKDISKDEPDKLYKMIELEMRGHDPAVLKSYSYFLTTAARHLDIEVGNCWTPKKAVHERLTVLRSIHVKKKYRVQYETRTYFTFAQLHKLTGSTADTYLEYVQRNLPEGVSMKVTKIALERFPEHLKPPVKEEITAE
ncbi:unnamed protein product [Nezara viridula]|uniref:Small ribosomal subunit protein uS10m n=1 Tax=Nezara viridula TaxID=85310 RepID=A0A9P0MP94_NEZVI|nr:unnamed protein product [Nezara viridula]